MDDYYIFDIPIYRCTQKEYETAQDAAVEKQLVRILDDQDILRESQPGTCERIRGTTSHAFGGPWQFNQIIGWLRLFAEGMKVGGHLWMAKGFRYSRRMPKKTLYLTTPSNVLATRFLGESTSKEIFEHTLDHIDAFAKQLRTRFLDLSVFRRVGPHIDWGGLLKTGFEHNQRRHKSAKQDVAD